jgi:quercetin dioxygenase-like cupin family protein
VAKYYFFCNNKQWCSAAKEVGMAFRSHPGSERSLSGPVRGFDLDEELARLREEKEWRDGQRNAITLRKGGGLNVVLLAMRAGDRLEEHSAPGPISLVIREGRIRFTAEGEAIEAGPETVLTCDAKIRHSVEALSNAVCLLTVATGG